MYIHVAQLCVMSILLEENFTRQKNNLSSEMFHYSSDAGKCLAAAVLHPEIEVPPTSNG